MTAPARFTQADINRAMKAARLAGYATVRVKIDQAGNLDVIASDGPSAPDDDWRARQPIYRDQ